MMILRSSPTSPFGRKVKVAAHHLGLIDRLRIEPADTNDPQDSLRSQNPLGKIPTLVLEDGSALYDSRVILDYLDTLAGGGRIIPAGLARFAVLTRQALADGMMDAALLRVYEARFRSQDTRNAAWMDHQAEKVRRGLAVLEQVIEPASEDITVADIATACMLGYLDLRFEGTWRHTHPRLVAWLDGFSDLVPSYDLTKPPPA
jgi:glutathione S-transferase